MHRILSVIVMGLLALSLLGCSAQVEETPTPESGYDYVPVVSVTGEVVPETWAVLSAQVGGTVVDVLVEEGAPVAEGDVLLKLDPTDARLAVQQAEAALEAVQSQLAFLEAGARSEAIAAAEAGVQAAEAALSQAVAERNRLRSGATEADIAAAETEVAEAEAAYRAALLHHDTIRDQKVDDWIKEEAALRLRAAEQALEAARWGLAQAQGGAGARIREAEAAVQSAAAQRDIAQAQLDLLRVGATSEQLAVARAQVTEAQVALDEARLVLERCELRAPFDGTIGSVDVRLGESVGPGQPLATIGDLGTLRVETTDLDEIDVVRVQPDQRVDVTFDALPERLFAGRVVRMSPMADPGAGGVTYAVVVELEERNPAILWGMTAFVDIEVE